MKQQGQVSGRHATAGSVPAVTVIENVSIVDVRDGSVEAGLSVVIADGTIRGVAASGEVEVGDETVVDGAGRFVVPRHRPGDLGAGPHAQGVLTARPSQDAFGDDARSSISRDGVRFGAVDTVTADRARVQAQDSTFASDLGGRLAPLCRGRCPSRGSH